MRERIVQCLAQGMTNQEIADQVHLSVRTVKWYIDNFMAKADLHGPADGRRLIVYAMQGKLN